MTTAYSHLTGAEVDTNSEAWRHECECRWLLANKPTKSTKHLHLYGVTDRASLFTKNPQTGAMDVLATDLPARWTTQSKPLMHFRGLAAADRLLADARKLYELQK